MKLSEYKNEDAIDLLADILEPVAKILADTELKKYIGKNRLKAIKTALKNHKKECIEILARIDGKKPSECNYTIISLTQSLLDLVSDEEMANFFISQAQGATMDI